LVLAISCSMILGGCKKDAEGEAASSGAASSTSSASSASPGEAAATVNGVKILMTDLEAIMAMSMGGGMGSKHQGGVPEMDEAAKNDLRAKMLSQMIDGEILYQESLKFPVEDLDAKADAQYADILKRYEKEEDFIKEIESNNLTVDKVILNIKKNISIQNYVESEVMSKIEISEDALKKHYDDNKRQFEKEETIKASHILIKVDAAATDAQKKEAYNKILAIKSRIDKGEEFAVVAKETSEGPSAPKGGDLGYFNKGMMVKPFEDVAFKTDLNKVSDVVETQYGFHIIKVTEKMAAETKSFEDVKEVISENLKRKDFQTTITKILEELKAKSKVDILL